MGNSSDNWLVMHLEGKGGTPGFALISERHPLPTIGVEALIEASHARPRKVGKAKWTGAHPLNLLAPLVEREVRRAGAPGDLTKQESGTTFGAVFGQLQRQGPA